MRPACEIIYIQSAKGWKWRALPQDGRAEAKASKETFELFYDCVAAARASGFTPNVKCL